MRKLRWLGPAVLLCLAFLMAWRPLALHWLGAAWPGLFSFWQSLQLLSPLPLAAVLLPLALLALFTPLVLWLRQRRTADALHRLAAVAGVLVLWLQLSWGVNYQREPVWQQLELQGPVTVEQQLALADYLLGVLEETAGAETDTDGAILSGRRQLDLLLGSLGHPGPLRVEVTALPAGWLLGFGVSGMIFPLTLEPFTDSGLPAWQQVIIGVHELSHVAGVAAEDDATLVAALAGLRAEHGFTRYAAALDAFSRLSLPPQERERLLAQLPARAASDLADARLAADRHRISWLADAQAGLLDWWLRLQGSGGGIADYSLGASRLPLALETGLLP